MDESLKGMIVPMAGVIFPLVTLSVGEEVCSPPVHCETAETEEGSESRVWLPHGRAGETVLFSGTLQVVHW